MFYFSIFSNSIKGNLDILTTSEIKLDSRFPSNKFTIEGYATPIRFDMLQNFPKSFQYTQTIETGFYFRSELLQEFNGSDSDINNLKDPQYTLQRVLDKYAPLKKRYAKANQQNFMDKELKLSWLDLS